MKVSRIYRHPVKSVGTESLEAVDLQVDRPFPGDRLFAITHGGGEWDPANPGWAHCRNFVRIANIPALGAANVFYSLDTQILSVKPVSGPGVDADLSKSDGRRTLAAWVEQHASSKLRGPFNLVEAPDTTFTDSRGQTPSIMSLASLRDLEKRVGATLDPRRFRGNIWIDGVEPWEEFSWIGQDIRLGTAEFRIIKPVERCIATAANPETGVRDVSPLPILKALFGAPNFGVQAAIHKGGTVSVDSDGELMNTSAALRVAGVDYVT